MSDLLPDDEHSLNACSDVALRFAVYGQYGSRTNALKALARRTPGFTPRQYDATLELFEKLYAAAERAVANNFVGRMGKSRYSEFEDIDFVASMAELDRHEPGYAIPQKQAVMNWAILYYHLK